MEQSAKKNFVLRTLSGALMAAAVVWATLEGRWTFSVLLLLIVIFAAIELGRLARRIGMNPLLSVLLGLVWIVLPLALLMCIYVNAGEWPVLCYIFIIWMNDIGGYVLGVTLGRRAGFDRKLCPRISPLKTWTGFFGGLAFGTGTGIVAAAAIGWDMWFWAGLAVVAVITGVAGDLAESMFKRAAGVKDSGRLIPGHGGMLDRFDSLLFSAPFVFAYIIILAG